MSEHTSETRDDAPAGKSSPPPAHGHAEHDHGHGHGHHYPNLAHHFDTPQQQFDDVVALKRAGNVIEAIKRYRELTGLGLKEAKDFVDRIR